MSIKYCPTCKTSHTIEQEFCLICSAELMFKQQGAVVADTNNFNRANESAVNTQIKFYDKDEAHEEKYNSAESLLDILNEERFFDKDNSSQCILPPSVMGQGWLLSDGDTVLNTNIYQRFVLVNNQGEQAWFTRYKVPVLTSDEVYKDLRVAGYVLDFGMTQLNDDTFCYEVTPTNEADSLSFVIQNQAKGEALAWQVLRCIKPLLNTFVSLQVQAISLSPDYLFKDASLNIFGAMQTNDQQVINANVLGIFDAKYLAPEVIEGMSEANSVVYAIGQIVSQAMWGYTLPVQSKDATPPFSIIKDDQLAKILMGTLYPDAKQRWSLAQLMSAIDGAQIEAPSWSTSNLAIDTFNIGGRDFNRLPDLLLYVRDNPSLWDQIIANIDVLLEFMQKTSHRSLANLLKKGNDLPALAFIKIQQAVIPNNLFFRQYQIGDKYFSQSINCLAQAVLSNDKQAAIHIDEWFSICQQL